MDRITTALLYGALVGTIAGASIVGLTRGGRTDAADAKRMCERTGGVLLVTEYNSKTGLTLNCFYPTAAASAVAPGFSDL